MLDRMVSILVANKSMQMVKIVLDLKFGKGRELVDGLCPLLRLLKLGERGVDIELHGVPEEFEVFL